MKILYKQEKHDHTGSLSRFGIQTCYCKQLSLKRDRGNITKKMHSHGGFELHLITQGYQEYRVDDQSYVLQPGNFLLIYPNIPHQVVSSSAQTQKFSFTFQKHSEQTLSCFSDTVSPRMLSDLEFISQEQPLQKEFSGLLLENCITEILILIFRLSGLSENTCHVPQDHNAIVAMAKQYIADNIDMAPGIGTVADYCHLSTKQLTRIFNAFEGQTPGEYVTKLRMKRIETLLLDTSFSLGEISEIMHFSNEYYFNSAFKKHFGMPPGEYRKMHGK